MCSINKENINPDMPTISAVENYINHQEGDILINKFFDRVMLVFDNEGNKSEEYKNSLKNRIDSIISLLVETNAINKEGDLIKKKT